LQVPRSIYYFRSTVFSLLGPRDFWVALIVAGFGFSLYWLIKALAFISQSIGVA
jgi:hypothetical protein